MSASEQASVHACVARDPALPFIRGCNLFPQERICKEARLHSRVQPAACKRGFLSKGFKSKVTDASAGSELRRLVVSALFVSFELGAQCRHERWVPTLGEAGVAGALGGAPMTAGGLNVGSFSLAVTLADADLDSCSLKLALPMSLGSLVFMMSEVTRRQPSCSREGWRKTERAKGDLLGVSGLSS